MMTEPNRFYFEIAMAQRLGRLAGVDLAARAGILGANLSGNALMIPSFGSVHRISADGVMDAHGSPPTPAVDSLLLDSVLRAPITPPATDAWISFRDFSGAGPLMSYFTGNTNKLIESYYAGADNSLQTACVGLSGKAINSAPGYDLCVELAALPRVSIRISFNDRDEDFPAQCILLFGKSAETYLTLKSMAVVGTWLAGKLMAPSGR
jgi:hypothetical protein